MPDKRFKVYYSNPMIVEIKARSAKAAREKFLNGNFDNSYQDPDGQISDPEMIVDVLTNKKYIY